MRKNRILIGLLIVVMLFGGIGFHYRKALAAEVSALSEKFRTLLDVYQIINLYYVDEVDSDKLIEGAIKGMAAELDPYSTYLESEQYEEYQDELLEPTFGGVGIIITIRNEKLTVVSPIKDTPGERAGLQGGDVILEVDGKPTDGISTLKASEWIKGEPGTVVELLIQRGEAEPEIYEVTRGIIQQVFLQYELLEDEIAYLNLYQFGLGCGREVKDALEELVDEKGAKAVILDLRTNPGGLLDEAVNVASSFIDKGPVVKIRSRDEVAESLYVDRFTKHYDLPLIVLVNGGSASASEIVAGAVQDTGVGTLLGTKTFGKGTVQQIIPLDDDSAFKITIARYYTPNDRFIHEQGIEPDVKVEFDMDQYDADQTDNQLEKAIELLKEMIETDTEVVDPAA